MKISCSRTNLLNSIQTVSRAVSTKSTMSIIECILIDAGSDEIKLTANNMELAIETMLDGETEEPGIVALEAKILQDIIRHLPDDEVTLSTDETYLTTIRCGKAKFNIIGKKGDDFPRLPEVKKDNPFVISQMTLKDVVRQTIFSIAENDNNKVMSGELLEVKNNELKLVSLDGHRISIRKLELKNEHDDIKVIIPGKALNEVSKIIAGDTEKDIQLFFTDKHVLFEFDQTIIVSRIIEGEYFNINQMLSNDYETKVDINKKDLLGCIERATLLVKEGDKKPIIISITDGDMELKINSAIGSMNENIEIEKEGEDIVIGFNPKFLIDALRVIDDETITLYIVNPKAPCTIKNVEESYIYLILPVNFNTVS